MKMKQQRNANEGAKTDKKEKTPKLMQKRRLNKGRKEV